MKTINISLITILLALSHPLAAFSQADKAFNGHIQLHGTVLNFKLKTPVAYASIGILNQPVGTISATNGHFDLNIEKEYMNDTLLVTMIGYSAIKIAIKQLTDTPLIYLTEKVIELKEVLIISNQFQHTEIVGMQTERSLFQVPIIPNGNKIPIIGAESGLKIQSKHYPALLSNFNFYVSANNFKYIKFRLNIYSLKNNLPDTLLFNNEILVSLKDYTTGWNQIDLTFYHMVINTDFAVTLQWVDYNKDMIEKPKILIPAALSFSHICYFRTTSQNKWNTVEGNFSCFATLQY